MADPPLHPDAGPIAFLLGTWHGEGKGEYPTIAPFRYREEVRFWHIGKPFLAYAQRTWDLDTGEPRHSEMGYWRAKPEGHIEIVLAHPTGIVEIQEGTVAPWVIEQRAGGGPVRGIAGTRVEVASTLVGLTSTAKSVARLTRTFVVSTDRFHYEVAMEAVGVRLTHHLAAELRRAAD